MASSQQQSLHMARHVEQRLMIATILTLLISLEENVLLSILSAGTSTPGDRDFEYAFRRKYFNTSDELDYVATSQLLPTVWT